MTMTKIASRKSCYTYGHGPLKYLSDYYKHQQKLADLGLLGEASALPPAFSLASFVSWLSPCSLSFC